MADKEKKNSLFREKSIERIESPEKLDDYLKVTSPGVWIVLAAIIIVLAGVCIWGALGHIDSTVSAAVVSDEDGTVCLVPQAALEGVVKYRNVTVNGQDLELTPSVLEPEAVSESTDVYVLLAGGLSFGDVVYRVDLAEPLPEGIYTGKLLIEEVSPLSLFFN